MSALGIDALSDREREVLAALGAHLTNAEIARDLHISVRTVESHVSSLLRKLDATDRRELATRATDVARRPPVTNADLVGLPPTWTSFVGREVELAEVAKALVESRLVTLLGPGGIGKTRIAGLAAQHAAGDFLAGGGFVNLVPVSAELVVQAVASALGVVEQAQEPLVESVHERLREGPSLLVLDNCEHVLDAAARVVEDVLAACPEVVVLATSRERLGVSGERVVPIPPLATGASGGGSDAERLFVDRAQDAGGGDGDPRTVAEICRRLDGMPLAIELAAARSASLGVDGLLAGLDDHLRLLSRSRAADDRHGSLRAVIDWSHQLLDDDERLLFRRLSVFAAPFDLPSATTVAADDDIGLASDVIGRLADKSLLVHLRDPAGSRWRMLETVRAYAGEQLAASGEADDLRDRHLRWAAGVAHDLEQALEADQRWQDGFDAVAADLRAALLATPAGTGADGLDFELAMAIGHLAYAHRFLEEGRGHFASAVDRAPDAAGAVVALTASADAAFAEMRGEVACELLLVAHDRALAVDDRVAAAIALADAASIAGRAPGTFSAPLPQERLVAMAERAAALAPAGDVGVATHVALAVAWECQQGPTVPATEDAEDALRLARAHGDPTLISGALDAVTAAVMFAGHLKRAAQVAAERLALLPRLPRHDPGVGSEVVDIFHMAGETTMAAGLLGQALEVARRSATDTVHLGLAHFAATHMVPPLALQGSFDEALAEAAVMLDGWERSGSPTAGWMSPSFYAAAMVHGLRGDDAEYERWWQRAGVMSTHSRFNSFGFFVRPRVALHLGRPDQPGPLMEGTGNDLSGNYQAYALALNAELAVIAGDPAAAAMLDGLRPLAAENDFVAAMLLRAAGRLHEDEAQLQAAVAAWEAIGARFERAATLLLLPARTAEGHAELDALGCRPPSAGVGR